MMSALVNPDFTLDDQGIIGLDHVYYNLIKPLLIEEALTRKEDELGKGGAFWSQPENSQAAHLKINTF